MEATRGRSILQFLVPFVMVLTLVAGFLTVNPAPAEAGGPAVWVGSPVNGRWPTADGCSGSGGQYPSATCSLPRAHHTFFFGMPYRGDWGVDLQGVSAGNSVRLYAAPRSSSTAVRAKVETVRNACAARSGESSAQTAARGGKVVVVGIYANGSRVGWVSYAHVQPSVSSGQWINRWGTQIGTVGRYTSNSCWRGVHLHFEMTNQSDYSCYNRGWRPGQAISRTNFMGFVGGRYATSPRTACP
jgi:hypothetical protein